MHFVLASRTDLYIGQQLEQEAAMLGFVDIIVGAS